MFFYEYEYQERCVSYQEGATWWLQTTRPAANAYQRYIPE